MRVEARHDPQRDQDLLRELVRQVWGSLKEDQQQHAETGGKEALTLLASEKKVVGLIQAEGHGVLPPSYPRGATSPPKSTRCVASLVGGSWVPPTAVLQKIGPPEFVSSGGAGRNYRIDQITGIVLLLVGTTDSPQDHTLVGVVPEVTQ